MTAEDRAECAEMQQWMEGGVDHHAMLAAAPDQVIDRDHMLTNASVYWFTATSASSSWPMYEELAASGGFAWPEGQKRVPTGVYSGGSPLVRRLAERDNTIVHWPEGNPGNHFVAMEVPDAHVADIRRFFALVR